MVQKEEGTGMRDEERRDKAPQVGVMAGPLGPGSKQQEGPSNPPILPT